MSDNIMLTISLLASNRPKTIRKCLDSLWPIRNAVPSELIIVDTSGDKEMRAILEEYTDQIVPFEWCNDFAKARNAGLSKARGEWFLFVDDDEWFIDSREIVDFFTKGYHTICGYASYIVRSFMDESCKEYGDDHLSRLFKMQEGIHFEGCVHEFITPVEGNHAALKSIAEHSGYIYQTEEQKRAHFNRNCPLVIKMIEEDPNNLRWHKQLVLEYMSMYDYENLYAASKAALEVVDTLDFTDVQTHVDRIRKDKSAIGTFFIGELEALLGLKRYEECIVVAKEMLLDERVGGLCKAGIQLLLADAYYYIGAFAKAEAGIRHYLKLADELPRDEKQYFLETGVLLVKDSFAQHKLLRAYSILICCGLEQDRMEVLEENLDKLEWDKPMVYIHEKILETLLKGYLRHPDAVIFEKVFALTVSQKALQAELYEVLAKWTQKNAASSEAWSGDVKSGMTFEESWQSLLDILSKVPITNWYLLSIQVQSGKNHENVAKQIKKQSFEEWQEVIGDFVRSVDWKEVEKAETYLLESSLAEDKKGEYLQMVLSEIRLVFDEKLQTIEGMEAAFCDYAKKALRFYKEEELPASGVAAVCLLRALESQERVLREEYLRQAMEIYPSFETVISRYLCLQESASVNEMEQLKLQIVSQVFELLDAGKKEDALQILGQLVQMMPQDGELAALLDELQH